MIYRSFRSTTDPSDLGLPLGYVAEDLYRTDPSQGRADYTGPTWQHGLDNQARREPII